MAVNIEIKARVADPAGLAEKARALAGAEAQVLRQQDTFFHVPRASGGRLKLRETGDGPGELIHYERSDAPGPRPSRYERVPVAEAALLRQVLTQVLGARGLVRKTRLLYLVGQTRVHLDEVEGLGSFLELEVVLEPGQSHEEGVRIARDLAGRLGVCDEDLLDRAYIDLLEEAPAGKSAADLENRKGQGNHS